MPLTPRQQRFVSEWLIDLNATQAYIRAGYKARGNAAESAAARLLRNVQVQAEIQKRQLKQQERTEIKADDVLRELAALAFLDPGDVLDFSDEVPRLKAPNTIPAAARRAISKVKVRRYTIGRGDDAREVEVVEFGLWDKVAALEKIGKHLGMFIERHELTGKDGGALLVKMVAGTNPTEVV